MPASLPPGFTQQSPAVDIPRVDSPSIAPVYAIRDSADLEELRAINAPKSQLPVGQYLRDNGLLTQEELNEALALQRSMEGHRIGWIMKTLGLFDEETLGRALAAHAGVHCVALGDYQASDDFRPLLPHHKWHGQGVAILHHQEAHGWVAMVDVTDAQIAKDVAAVIEKPVLRVMATHEDILKFLASDRHGAASGSSGDSADFDWTSPGTWV